MADRRNDMHGFARDCRDHAVGVTRKDMSALNICEEGELSPEATVKKFLTVQRTGLCFRFR